MPPARRRNCAGEVIGGERAAPRRVRGAGTAYSEVGAEVARGGQAGEEDRKDGCHPKFGGRNSKSGQECVWSLGDLFVPEVNCSGTSSAFCQSLNREGVVPHHPWPTARPAAHVHRRLGCADCQFVENTCGGCFECYTPDNETDPDHSCSQVQSGQPLPTPTLQTTGAANAIGPAGLGATSLRVRIAKTDCEPLQALAVRLREGDGEWRTIYQGWPAGFFSTADKHVVSIDYPPEASARRLQAVAAAAALHDRRRLAASEGSGGECPNSWCRQGTHPWNGNGYCDQDCNTME